MRSPHALYQLSQVNHGLGYRGHPSLQVCVLNPTRPGNLMTASAIPRGGTRPNIAKTKSSEKFGFAGIPDIRRGMNTLALQVQQDLGRDPHAGEIFCFRGRRGDLVKLLWHDGVGGCRSIRSGWKPGSSSGRAAAPAKRSRYRRRNSAIFWTNILLELFSRWLSKSVRSREEINGAK